MAAARKSRILDWDVTTPESERNGYGWPQIVPTELENGMAIKGGSAVLSQIHGAFSARWDWTPLLQCPKIVHDRHYPIAPKLVLLQSEDHAAFPKREPLQKASRHTIWLPLLLQSSLRTMSFSLFQAKPAFALSLLA